VKGLLLVSLALLALAGCGDSSSSPPSNASTDRGWNSPAQLEQDAVGTKGLRVCELLPVGKVERVVHVDGLRATPNDSLDLAQCRYADHGVNVRVLLDGASQAIRRYFDQQAEAQQKFNTIPAMKPRDVHGVGDDKTYGSAGRLLDARAPPARRHRRQAHRPRDRRRPGSQADAPQAGGRRAGPGPVRGRRGAVGPPGDRVRTTGRSEGRIVRATMGPCPARAPRRSSPSAVAASPRRPAIRCSTTTSCR
jgi:hypothetical protein